MDAATLIVSTVIVSASGALSPGPLTVSAVAVGARGAARGGLLVALGHTMFELPYIIAIALLSLSAGEFLKRPSVSYILALIMLGFISFFSCASVRDGINVLRGGSLQAGKGRMHGFSPVLVGLLLTCLNPYFLVWWLSVGLPLVRLSSSMGAPYLLLMYVAHVWLDYLWLALMGLAGKGGARLLGSRGYGALLVALGLLLAVFATDLSLKAFLNANLLPL
jgi:threonine/homoserine/homoserine lactone efflux protein